MSLKFTNLRLYSNPPGANELTPKNNFSYFRCVPAMVSSPGLSDEEFESVSQVTGPVSGLTPTMSSITNPLKIIK